MSEARERLEAVQERIATACATVGRSASEVLLLAVSKKHSATEIAEMADMGVKAFGESYVAEWQEKAAALPQVKWHFVGHLQSRKAKLVAGRVDLIHGVDRASAVNALARAAHEPIDVLLQVNVALDPNKSGVHPDDFLELLQLATEQENLRVRGLMTMPPWTADPEGAREHFRDLARLLTVGREWLEAQGDESGADAFTELSMGMSGDLEVAIEEGATIVRVGTALMGPRGTA